MAEDTKGRIEGFDEAFGTDTKVQDEGAWMTVPAMPGNRIRLRSQHTALVRNMAAHLNRRHAPLFAARKPVPAEEQDKDRTTLLSKAIVTGWEGPKFEAVGACTPGNVAAVMARYPAFADLCYGWSDTRENYGLEGTEDVKGNSSESSSAT